MSMFSPIRKRHPLLKILNNSLVDLPAPANLSIWWNFGSLLGLRLIIQVLTGIFLAIHYSAHTDLAFASVVHICRDVNYGWLLRYVHANGASIFFVCLYIHIGRGIYYGSYYNRETWRVGVILLLLVMATAFVGYVLPWGQIRFWGATVITNLLSAIPYLGPSLVEWLWGGFAVGNATLTRFFTFHFLLPFVIMGVSVIHLMYLHETGSNNPLGINCYCRMVPFHPYYRYKDLVGMVVALFILCFFSLLFPKSLGDPENFIPANPMVTPIHIKPEWYFLWAYAILRSIPNKFGGVFAMFSAILVLFLLPFIRCQERRSLAFYPASQVLFWCLVADVILLTWIGARPVESPYEFLGQVFTGFYFLYFLLRPGFTWVWDWFINLEAVYVKLPRKISKMRWRSYA